MHGTRPIEKRAPFFPKQSERFDGKARNFLAAAPYVGGTRRYLIARIGLLFAQHGRERGRARVSIQRSPPAGPRATRNFWGPRSQPLIYFALSIARPTIGAGLRPRPHISISGGRARFARNKMQPAGSPRPRRRLMPSTITCAHTEDYWREAIRAGAETVSAHGAFLKLRCWDFFGYGSWRRSRPNLRLHVATRGIK